MRVARTFSEAQTLCNILALNRLNMMMRQPTVILLSAACARAFMLCSLHRGLASTGHGLARHIGSTTAPRCGWQSVKRATITATATPEGFEMGSEQLKALPDSITDEQLEAMNVEAFTAFCSTAREHLGYDQDKVIGSLNKRYVGLCKDPSTLVEALVAIKKADPERPYNRYLYEPNPLHHYSKEVLQIMLKYKENCTADIYAAIWDADISWTREDVKQLPAELLDAAKVYTYKHMVARPKCNDSSSENIDKDDEDDHTTTIGNVAIES
jgi:hypothetical protein